MLMAPTNEMVSRDYLASLPVPEATDTFQPIPHNEFVDTIEEALDFRRIQIESSSFAVSKDGMKMFGVLDVNQEYDDVRFSIGLRNSNDKSMRIGMVAGYRVVVCTNMMFAGDFNPLLAKHTKNFELADSVSVGVDRIFRQWEPMKFQIEKRRLTYLKDDEARLFIYKAFLENGFPITLMKSVHKNYFDPDFVEFKQDSLWTMENAFTSAIHTLKPTSQFQVTAKLGAYLSKATNSLS